MVARMLNEQDGGPESIPCTKGKEMKLAAMYICVSGFITTGVFTTPVVDSCHTTVTYDNGTWTMDCVDFCTGDCYVVPTTDWEGTSGFSCKCPSDNDDACCEAVYIPDAPRKVSFGGLCGNGCDPGTECKQGSDNFGPGQYLYYAYCLNN